MTKSPVKRSAANRDSRFVSIILWAALLTAGYSLLTAAPPARAQETSGAFTGGSVKIGWDNRNCAPALEGAIRYNSSGPAIEYCNGSNWAEAPVPDCTDDSTALCLLDTTRSDSDADFIASNICNGVNILGVTGNRTCS